MTIGGKISVLSRLRAGLDHNIWGVTRWSQPGRTRPDRRRRAPARSSARAAALAVAPEVRTSSTRTILKPAQRRARRDAKRPLHVGRPLLAGQADLAAGRFHPHEPVRLERLAALTRQRLGERRGLIEPPLPEPQRMQRHRHDQRPLRRARRPPPAPSRRRAAWRGRRGRNISADGRGGAPARPRTARRRGRGGTPADRRSPAATAAPRRGPARTACRAGRKTAAR